MLRYTFHTILFFYVILLLSACNTSKTISSPEPTQREMTAEEKVYLDSLLNKQIVNLDLNSDVRKIIYRNIKEVLGAGFVNQNDTKIVCNVYVGRDGEIVYAKIDEGNTTATMNENQREKVTKGFLGYRYEINERAPLIERSKISVVLKSIRAYNNY